MCEHDAIRLFEAWAKQEATWRPEHCTNPEAIIDQLTQRLSWREAQPLTRDFFRDFAADLNLELEHVPFYDPVSGVYQCLCGDSMPCTVAHELRVFNNQTGKRSR